MSLEKSPDAADESASGKPTPTPAGAPAAKAAGQPADAKLTAGTAGTPPIGTAAHDVPAATAAPGEPARFGLTSAPAGTVVAPSGGAVVQRAAQGGTGSVAVATHAAPGGETCANCGALLTGHYCSNCGQRREHEIHSIWHFTQEAAEDLTHADSRLWSTMQALLFKPGLLTREFLVGRRVKYLPPIRLYLVLSVLFFLILGSLGGHEHKAFVYEEHNGNTTIGMVDPNEGALAARPGETPEQRVRRVCKPDYDGPLRKFVVPFIEKGCRQSLLDNGNTLAEATLHNIPRAMFIFVPALAVVMKLLYWRPRRYYIEHLLFFVHNHAFLFALFGLYELLLRIVPAALDGWIQLVVWGYTAYYVFVSMRRVYGQGRVRTFVKFTALSFAYLFGAALTLALTVTYSVYAL